MQQREKGETGVVPLCSAKRIQCRLKYARTLVLGHGSSPLSPTQTETGNQVTSASCARRGATSQGLMWVKYEPRPFAVDSHFGETREDFTVIEQATGQQYRCDLPGLRLSEQR